MSAKYPRRIRRATLLFHELLGNRSPSVMGSLSPAGLCPVTFAPRGGSALMAETTCESVSRATAPLISFGRELVRWARSTTDLSDSAPGRNGDRMRPQA